MGWSDVLRRFGGTLRALARRAEGAAATEFAIIVPVLGVLLTGTIDLAQLGNQGLTLDAAVRAGANYATLHATNTTAIQCIIGQSVSCPPGTSPYETFPGSVNVTFPNQGVYAPLDPQFCTLDNGAAVSCDPSVACNSAQCPKHFYVTIHAVWTLPAPLMPFGIMPSSISRTLTVRVQ
jgi:Flp pilus assembly pilin Flp